MSRLEDCVLGWDPAPVRTVDAMSPTSATQLAALLGTGEAPDLDWDLPAFWHWVYFPEFAAQADLGPDGHPVHGHFLPPLPQRTRMFAGGRLTLTSPLRLGEPARRRSSLAGVRPTQGRSGELFVTVRHEIGTGKDVCVIDEQDLVYRSGAVARAAEPEPADRPAPAAGPGGVWQRPLVTDPSVLFRFSALTANAHRIHYDQPYTTGTEGYPGLVVHGPLLVLAMAELARAPGRWVTSMAYRLTHPVFVADPVLVVGAPKEHGRSEVAEVSVLGPGGVVCAHATAGLGR